MKEYTRSTEFPVTLSVENSQKHTFAVFGKNGLDRIESEPVITVKNKSHAGYPSSGKYTYF